MKLTGYDIDGVLTNGIKPEGDYVIVSGRTLAEYGDFVKKLAQNAPVYIRAIGEFGDRQAAGEWKASIVNLLKISKFYEDDPVQAGIIKVNNPDCEVIIVQ